MRQCRVLTYRWPFPQYYPLLLQLCIRKLIPLPSNRQGLGFSLHTTSRINSAPATSTMALNFDRPIIPLSAVLNCSSCLATSWAHPHCSTCIEGETNEQRKEGMPEIRRPERNDCTFFNSRLLNPCLEAHHTPRLFIRHCAREQGANSGHVGDSCN